MAFSPDGRRLATAGEDRKVKIWDTASGHEVLTLSGHTDMIYSVAFSPDGRHLASAGAGTVEGPEMIRIWDAPEEKKPAGVVNPALPSPEDLPVSHLGEVEECLAAGQTFAARSHLERPSQGSRGGLAGVRPIFKLLRKFRIHPTPPLGPQLLANSRIDC